VATDEYFNLVSLLLPGNGTNGQQNNTFLDASTNNFTVTRNGNTTQGTFSPFSQTGWSNYFDGSGDNLSVADNAAFEFGSGSFTVEMWFYLGASGVNALITKNRSGTSPEGGLDIDVSTTTIRTYIDGNAGTTLVPNITTTISLNTWYHLAVVRSVSGGTNNYVFLNGVLVGSSTTSTAFADTSQPLRIGTDNLSGSNYNQLTGYISNLRIVKGTAVYTSAFTPPTAPLTAISGTSLLTCQSNRFIDNSSNAFAITVNGNTSVQAFSPFKPTAAYSAATVGGSGYFDNNGDYLTAATNAAFNVSNGNFTWEAWLYPNSFADTFEPIYVTGTGAETGGLWIGKNSSNFVVRASSVADQLTYNVMPTVNAWTHVVAVRSGTTLSLYYNGARVATTTNSYTFTQGAISIGSDLPAGGTSYFNGYISNLRLVKGSAVYDPTSTTLTVPTAPVTAIANTSLLLNYTNAGITDATAKNVAETVGGAAISTAQSKFGGSSMAFDGTGDWLIVPSSVNYTMGSGDFTWELWLRTNVIPVSEFDAIFDTRPASTQGAYQLLYLDQVDGKIKYWVSSADRIVSTNAISINTWYHVALTRSGTSTKLFIDGTQTGSTYTDSTVYLQSSLIIGGSYGGGASIGRGFNGYMSDFRVTKGYARYTANFTPPTQAFPTQ
jgi:hypothetical protein